MTVKLCLVCYGPPVPELWRLYFRELRMNQTSGVIRGYVVYTTMATFPVWLAQVEHFEQYTSNYIHFIRRDLTRGLAGRMVANWWLRHSQTR